MDCWMCEAPATETVTMTDLHDHEKDIDTCSACAELLESDGCAAEFPGRGYIVTFRAAIAGAK